MNNGKICVSVCAATVDEMITKIKRAEEFADVIEVRFDCLAPAEIDYAISQIRNDPAVPRDLLLLTFRPVEQGGFRKDLTVQERREFWTSGLDPHCWGGDFEIEIEDDAFSGLWTNRIVSYHNFASVPGDLISIYKRLCETYHDIIKIAVGVEDVSDAIPLWNLLGRTLLDNATIALNLETFNLKTNAIDRSKQIIPIAMGEAGKWTRILGLAHGAFMTYASLGSGNETAPGQITARDLIETYRVKELDLSTKVFGVVGDPVPGSLSPYIHNPAFADAGVNAVFIPLQVTDLDEFMRRMVKMETREVELNFAGFSVTMPHKQAIIKHLDAIDPTAEKIGAVNTVRIDGDKLTGYNTDAHGFITPLKARYGDLNGARVAILGAGGAARACVFALKQEKANVTVFGRDSAKAKLFADEFGIAYKQLTIDNSPLRTDVVVNATPIGMKGHLENETPLTGGQLAGVKFVYDLVTMPADTPIIREAKKANIPAIGGIEMLIEQGAKQFEIWTGQAAPIEKMRESVLTRIQRKERWM